MILRRSTPSKSAAPRLALQALEDRAVPAAAVFHAGVLTVTANPNETITVTPTGTTAGSFTVSDGSPNLVFNSAAAGPATSLVTNFHAAGQGTLSVGDGLKLNGYFTVRGGAAATTVTLAGAVTVGKGFHFLGTGAGNDTVTAGTDFRVGGAAIFKMGGGTNALTLGGASINGGVVVRGGAGADTVNVSSAGLPAATGGNLPTVAVGRNFDVALGNGVNTLTGDGTVGLTAGGHFLYAGGLNADVVDFQDAAANPLVAVTGSLVIRGGRGVGGANDFSFSRLTVGRNAVIYGGLDADRVDIDGDASITRSVGLYLGGGANTAAVGYQTKPVTVGGNLTYVGGAGDDVFSAGATTVTRHLIVNLGAATGQGQKLLLGEAAAVFAGGNQLALPPVNVGGNAVLRGGNGVDRFQLDYFTVQGRLTVVTGNGDDTVTASRATVTGRTNIYLGSGRDSFVADPTLSSVTTRVITTAGLDPTQVLRLVNLGVLHGLTGDLLGGLVTDIVTNGIGSAGLTGLAGSLSAHLLSAADTATLLNNLKLTGVLQLLDDATAFNLSESALTDLLGCVGLSGIPLIAQVTTIIDNLLGVGQLGVINTLVSHLQATDLDTLVAQAGGLTDGQLAAILAGFNALNLADAQLTGLLTTLAGLQLNTQALAGLLASLSAELLTLPLVGTTWSTVLETVTTHRNTTSRYASFNLWGQAGEDAVTLGAADSKVTFTGIARLYGGLGIDTLQSSTRNTYAAPTNPRFKNYEDFETGTF